MSALLTLTERTDDISQRGQRLVDIDRFLQTILIGPCSGGVEPFATGEIHWFVSLSGSASHAGSPRLSIASHFSSVRGLNPFTLRVKTECDRDDRSFIKVAATALLDLAFSRSVDTCRELLKGTAVSARYSGIDPPLITSVTLILPSLSNLISCFLVSNWPLPSKSLI
jgi:hypothetical protein